MAVSRKLIHQVGSPPNCQRPTGKVVTEIEKRILRNRVEEMFAVTQHGDNTAGGPESLETNGEPIRFVVLDADFREFDVAPKFGRCSGETATLFSACATIRVRIKNSSASLRIGDLRTSHLARHR
jgi:hypothetical protein